MAERLLREPVKQHGHVLWGMLVMLGMLTELALGSLQLAAQEGISVGLREKRLQQVQRLQVIARQVSQLPIPARSDQPGELWHPASQSLQQGCGQGERASYVATRQLCSSPDQPLLAAQRRVGEWQWRLMPVTDSVMSDEGSDVAAFPGLQATVWQLEVVVAGSGGKAVRGLWQQYQQVSP